MVRVNIEKYYYVTYKSEGDYVSILTILIPLENLIQYSFFDG